MTNIILSQSHLRILVNRFISITFLLDLEMCRSNSHLIQFSWWSLFSFTHFRIIYYCFIDSAITFSGINSDSTNGNQIRPYLIILTRSSTLWSSICTLYKNLAIANRSRVSCAHSAEGIYDNPVTLKSRLRVTQGNWKRNHWVDHTRLTIRRVIGR